MAKNMGLVIVGILGIALSACGGDALAATDAAGVSRKVFNNFDLIPATPQSSVPVSGEGWAYSAAALGTSGWTRTSKYPDGQTYDFFKKYSTTYNTEHMGFENYGYLEVDGVRKVSGNSLRYVVTGGKNITTCPNGPGTDCLSSGLPMHDKKTFLDYLSKNQNPFGDITVGAPYLYYQNSTSTSNPTPFLESRGANRLSVYIWLPAELSVGTGGYRVPPSRTITTGPFSSVPRSAVFPNTTSTTTVGGHFYNDFPINGGGWAHLHLDGHPVHNNGFSSASAYPYPSKSMRDIGVPFFDNLSRMYFAIAKYNGFTKPPYSVWFDEMEFINDPEPQNNETINNVAVLYNPASDSFNLGFCDKYKDNANSFSTYEMRYSFSPITNANWSTAKPVHVLPHTGFGQTDNYNGKIVKNTPYYVSVWAPFKLADADQSALSVGTMVYFAIKDISQANGDGASPAVAKGGRDYANYPSTFDYAGDKPALKLIKRIDYRISERTGPAPPQNLRIVQ